MIVNSASSYEGGKSNVLMRVQAELVQALRVRRNHGGDLANVVLLARLSGQTQGLAQDHADNLE